MSNPQVKHGDVYILFSQNEDIGRAHYRYDPSVFPGRPDIVVDVDGEDVNEYTVANFTAVGRTYVFHGNQAHPSEGLKLRYGDALTAAAYFIGQIPPDLNPGASSGRKGYIHAYQMSNPVDSLGNVNNDDYVVLLRIRFFDPADGQRYLAILDSAAAATDKAFPFVTPELTFSGMQYDNVANTMHPAAPSLVDGALRKAGFDAHGVYGRGGTTGAMMLDYLPGAPCIYAGQQAAHSIYEWCCIEELQQILTACIHIVSDTATLPR